MDASDAAERELIIPNSKNIEITITTKRVPPNLIKITFNIDNQISIQKNISKHLNRLIIERTGNI